ncbi:unnamed protein product, partial [Phaeothamnion confervicola]
DRRAHSFDRAFVADEDLFNPVIFPCSAEGERLKWVKECGFGAFAAFDFTSAARDSASRLLPCNVGVRHFNLYRRASFPALNSLSLFVRSRRRRARGVRGLRVRDGVLRRGGKAPRAAFHLPGAPLARAARNRGPAYRREPRSAAARRRRRVRVEAAAARAPRPAFRQQPRRRQHQRQAQYAPLPQPQAAPGVKDAPTSLHPRSAEQGINGRKDTGGGNLGTLLAVLRFRFGVDNENPGWPIGR